MTAAGPGRAADLRVTVTVKNNKLLRAIELAGFDSVAAFVRSCPGLVYPQVIAFLSLRRAPVLANGDWAVDVLRMAGALKCPPEDLFPQEFLTRPLRKNSASREVDTKDLGAFLPAYAPSPERLLEQAEAKRLVDDMLATLTPREREVIRRRFGFDGPEMTLDQAGVGMGRDGQDVSRTRIAQLEAKAMRKMRHPLRARALRQIAGDLPD